MTATHKWKPHLTCPNCGTAMDRRAKLCQSCRGIWNRRKATEWRLAHPEWYKEAKRKCVEKNPEKYREQHRRKRAARPSHYKRINQASNLRNSYGISLAEYDVLVIAQQGRCAICREPGDRARFLAVDHDHVSGKIRGLLCGHCNRGIGLLREDPDRLVSAIIYLTRNETDGNATGKQ